MEINIEAYPLHWPLGYPRTEKPKASRFSDIMTIAEARNSLLHELRLLGATNTIISTNIPVKKDGFLYASAKKTGDNGVAVYFNLKDEPRVLACDKWVRLQDNLHALKLTIDALRGLDRWGVSDMISRAFAGFKALPEHGSGKTWYEVLEIDHFSTVDEIQQAFRKKIKQVHPDVGGSLEEMNVVTEARKQGLESLGYNPETL